MGKAQSGAASGGSGWSTWRPGLRSWRRRGSLAALLLALYALAGFILLPWLIRPRIESAAGSFLGRKVTLARLRLNPFALSVSAEGLDITDRDGAPLLRWDRLGVNFEAVSSLFRREWVFREIHLVGATARLAMGADGKLNIDDILASFSEKPPEGAPPPPAPLPVIRVGRLRVEDTSASFVDRSTGSTFTTTLGPLRIDLRDFTTHADEQSAYSFRGRTEKAEAFSWTGRFGVAPLQSEGEFSLGKVSLAKYHPYYRGTVPFDIRDGNGDIKARYRFAWGPGRKELRIADAAATIRDLKLSEHDKEEVAFDAPLTEASGGNFDLLSMVVSVDRLTSKGGRVLLRQDKDGRVNLLDMILPFFAEDTALPATPAPSLAAAPKPPAGSPAAPTASIGELSFLDYTMEVEDLTPPRPVKVRLDQIQLTLVKVDNRIQTRSKGNLDLRWNGEGTLHADGDLSLVGLNGDLAVKLDGIDVVPVDPYVEPALDMRVRTGLFYADGRIRADLIDAEHPKVAFTGDIRMDSFAAVDAAKREDFLRWNSVRMSQLEYSLEEDRTRVGSLEVSGAEAILSRASDGTINLFTVLRMPQWTAEPVEPEPAAPAEGAAPGSEPAPPAAVEEAAKPAPAPPAGGTTGDTRIARARIRGSRIRLVDKAVTPPVNLALTRIDGTLTGLSSRLGARADVKVTARFDDTAPVTLEGKVDPLGADVFTDLVLKANGMDLGPMGPYSSQYLGYALDRARLDLDMRYLLENRLLKAENLFTANPFLLGEKTESPDATGLPVKLGLALLRDREGVIKLDVPVEGSLDDPKFRLGRVILRAVVNVFTKLVTSPFTLLAKAFAGKEVDLSTIDFLPGESALDGEARERVDALTKALGERPGLTLALLGGSDPAVDTDALKRSRLDGMVRAEKWRSLGRKERAATKPESVALAVEEYPKFVKAAWKTFREGRPPEPEAVKPKLPEEMEDWMLARIEIGPADLAALAGDRARAVRDGLLASGIAAERVFLREGPGGTAARVTLELQ